MKTNKKILFLILLSILILPVKTFAQVGLDCPGDMSIDNIACNAVNTALYIAAAIVIILWVVTGVLFLMAQGAPEKLNKAKLALFTSVVGTIVVILAFYGMDLVGKAFGI